MESALYSVYTLVVLYQKSHSFASLTCSISDTPQLVCKQRTRALSMKYSICFRLMRDWKLENLPNGKEISVVPFRMEKEECLWRYSTISERNFRKNYLTIWLQTEISGFFGQMVSTPVFSCLETPMKHSHSFLKYYIQTRKVMKLNYGLWKVMKK